MPRSGDRSLRVPVTVGRWGMSVITVALVATMAGGGLGARTQETTGQANDPGDGPVELGATGESDGFGGWALGDLPLGFGDGGAPLGFDPSKLPSDGTIPAVAGGSTPIVTQLGMSGIPEIALRAYVRAATTMAVTEPHCALDWPVLAGIGRVESNHGRYGGSQLRENGDTTTPIRGLPLDGREGVARILDTDNGMMDGDPVYDRAVGPMQFLPSTWKIVGADGNSDGTSSPDNLYDAALSAAVYLCAGGGNLANQDELVAAVLRYNHSMDYVNLVLSLADRYSREHTTVPVTGPGGTVPTVHDPVLPPATPPGTPPGVPSTGGGGGSTGGGGSSGGGAGGGGSHLDPPPSDGGGGGGGHLDPPSDTPPPDDPTDPTDGPSEGGQPSDGGSPTGSATPSATPTASCEPSPSDSPSASGSPSASASPSASSTANPPAPTAVPGPAPGAEPEPTAEPTCS